MYVLSPKSFIVVIGLNFQGSSMKGGEEIANAWALDNQALPQDYHVPLLEEVSTGDYVLVVPPNR